MEKEDRTENYKSYHLSLTEVLKIAAIAFAVQYIIFNFFIVYAIIPSGSMESTINIGDKIIADRVLFRISGVERGDIIIFHPPIEDKERTYYVKRVIGLPGDTIEGIDGYVYINGEKLEETYTKEFIDEDFGPYIVPNDCYFMLGDNRTNSYDSRSWNNKYISSDKIVGKAILKYNGSFYIFKTPSYNIK